MNLYLDTFELKGSVAPCQRGDHFEKAKIDSGLLWIKYFSGDTWTGIPLDQVGTVTWLPPSAKG